MPRIVLARDLQHEQIEFPTATPHREGRRGGGKSSLHLRRGSVRDVTEEELAYIKAERPEVHRCLDVLPEPKKSPTLARKLASIARRQAADEALAAPKPTGKPAKATSGGSRPRKPKSETPAG